MGDENIQSESSKASMPRSGGVKTSMFALVEVLILILPSSVPLSGVLICPLFRSSGRLSDPICRARGSPVALSMALGSSDGGDRPKALVPSMAQ